MTLSRSTPRLRATRFLYLAVLAVVAFSNGRALTGTVGLVAQMSGLVLAAAASLGRIWVSAFIAGRKDADLVTEGPYSMVRNPLYGLSLIAALGLALGTRSLVVLLVLPAMQGALLMLAVRSEEAFMARTHGVAYAAYLDRVPRYWPRPSLYQTVRSLQVDPAVFWKAFLDAGSLLLLYALVLLADGLSVAGRLPALLAIP